MAKRIARSAFAIAAGFAVGVMATSLLGAAARAADDCLTEPSGDKPDGQRWYYRLDRAKNQRCWYLKDAATPASPAAKPQQPSAWEFAQPGPPKAGPRRSDPVAPRAGAPSPSAAPTRSRSDDGPTSPAAPRPAPVPTADQGWPALPSDIGPQFSEVAPQAATQAPQVAPAPQEPAPPMLSPDDAPLLTNAAPAEPEGGQTASKPARPIAPIPTLLVIVIGALAISGLTASGLYRLGRIGRRRRRNANWQTAIAVTRRSRRKPRANTKVVAAAGQAAHFKKKSAKNSTHSAVASGLAGAPRLSDQASLGISTATIDRNTAGLVDLLATSAVQSTVMPAASATLGAPADLGPRFAGPSAAPCLPDTVELENLLSSRAGKMAPAVAGTERMEAPTDAATTAVLPELTEIENALKSAGPPAAAIPPQAAPGNSVRLVTVGNADPAAALMDLLESRFAPPDGDATSSVQAVVPDRPGSNDRSSWLRVPPTPSNGDVSMPPLDFIPRPQALRPRVHDVKQDHSLDGIQDILARLARQG